MYFFIGLPIRQKDKMLGCWFYLLQSYISLLHPSPKCLVVGVKFSNPFPYQGLVKKPHLLPISSSSSFF